MIETYDRRLDAAVIALRRGWFKRVDVVARLLMVHEDAVKRALLDSSSRDAYRDSQR